MAKYGASGTEFYRLEGGGGPYTSLSFAKAARSNISRRENRWRPESKWWPKIQKLEACHEHSGYGPCYAVLEWVDVEE